MTPPTKNDDATMTHGIEKELSLSQSLLSRHGEVSRVEAH